MSFEDIIKEDRVPLTKARLIHDLIRLGIKKGDYLLVHSSLNKIGYIIGKEETLVDALIDIVGEDGLIVMPTQTSDNSDPSTWGNPSVPSSWFSLIKENIPGFDKDITPTFGMGAVVEYFRKLKIVYRSNHPQVSFAAFGNRKQELLENHPYEYGLNDDSPLGLMYKWKFKILMLGTDYGTCTAMHLSEYRSKCRKETMLESAVYINNERKWIKYPDVELDSGIFNEIGSFYEMKNYVTIRKVGYANSRLIDMKSLIDFTTNYLSK